MGNYSYIFNAHPGVIDAYYTQYKQQPESVEAGWRVFFEGFEFAAAHSNGNGAASTATSPNLAKEFAVFSLIQAYRERAHLIAKTNPIRKRKDRQPSLQLQHFGLSDADLATHFTIGSQLGLNNPTLQQIIDRLQHIYCRSIGFEYGYIQNQERHNWLKNQIENIQGDEYGLSLAEKRRILEKLNDAVVFEDFLHTKFVGQKRFSLEGGETTIAALDTLINETAAQGVQEVIIGMAHRGRLNVLANILHKTYENIFNEFEGKVARDSVYGSGDVKYHLGFSSQVNTPSGNSVYLKLVPNPSHLEAVNPVVTGFARAKGDLLYNDDYSKTLPILVHGDAAVAGQGIVYETLQMSLLHGYRTHGTIHFVINNQIGFTTDFEDARSAHYCTSVAAMVEAPVFHVNGDDPEAVAHACKLASAYRQKFGADVFIDMVCYRRHGHNESDEPRFTQPGMYVEIAKHPNPRDIYSKYLSEHNNPELAELAKTMDEAYRNVLQDRLNQVKQNHLPYVYQEPEVEWRKLKRFKTVADLERSPITAIDTDKVNAIVESYLAIPEGFKPISNIQRLFKNQRNLFEKGVFDWAMGELLAYGSILLDGNDVRMSGQDVKRGTFSHRHAVIFSMPDDPETPPQQHNRLNSIQAKQGKFRIYNSLLSEYAVLGFEFGYSLASPNSLVLWEAQFGDFANGAQTMIDQFITSSESKWQRSSGIVMLLPHGYEGQGPEHSSARLERFLQSAAENNITVANITTPANYFHAIRRQLARDFRMPLVVMSPKSLLRYEKCVSPLADFTHGGFQEVIDDVVCSANAKAAAKVKRVLLCTGKVYYDLLNEQQKDNRTDVAIVRLEQIAPLPKKQLEACLGAYSKAKELCWVQEEPANMGAWTYVLTELGRFDMRYIGRAAASSPAVGLKSLSDEQQRSIVQAAFAPF